MISNHCYICVFHFLSTVVSLGFINHSIFEHRVIHSVVVDEDPSAGSPPLLV